MSTVPTPRVGIRPEWVAIIILGGVVAWPHIQPYIPKPDPFVSLGKSYRADASAAYAVGWDAGASSLEAGKSMGDSQKAFQDAWLKARTDAFAGKVAPKFAAILPEGVEPDANQRGRMAQAWRGLARGLRSR